MADLEARRRKLDQDIADQEGRLQREAASLWTGPLANSWCSRFRWLKWQAHLKASSPALAQENAWLRRRR